MCRIILDKGDYQPTVCHARVPCEYYRVPCEYYRVPSEYYQPTVRRATLSREDPAPPQCSPLTRSPRPVAAVSRGQDKERDAVQDNLLRSACACEGAPSIAHVSQAHTTREAPGAVLAGTSRRSSPRSA